MILTLDEKHKADLQFIINQPKEVIEEFVKTAVDFIRNGAKPNLYTSAAKALKVDVRQVEAVIEAIANLFVEASKLQLSENDFMDSLAINSLNFSNELTTQLKELYLARLPEIRTFQKDMFFDLPHYQNCDWRLDVQIASRNVRNQLDPVFILRFDIAENGVTKSHFVQTDYANLKHMVDELQIALKEVNTPHCRRIMRNIK